MMNARDFLFPAFFADALALGAHWIYDDAEISEAFPDGISGYEDPRSDYHPGKTAGDFTHYGDQTLVLLESLARHHGFDRAAWRKDWLSFWRGNPTSYLDGATRRTLDNATSGIDRSSESHDLGGASRVAALLALLPAEEDELAKMAAVQTGLTHGDPRVSAVADFLVRAAFRISGGAGFSEAFRSLVTPQIPDLGAAIRAAGGGGRDLLVDLGLSCDVGKAFPLTIALALKYEAAPVTALCENARLGGDSAARGLALGLLLGARHGLAAFPDAWMESLHARGRIEAALEQLQPRLA